MFTSRGGDNCVGLFTAVVDRMEQNFASIVLVRHCFILSEHSNKTVHWPKYAASHAQSCCCLSANGLKIKEEIKRGTKRNVCGAVSISCLLTRVWTSCKQKSGERTSCTFCLLLWLCFSKHTSPLSVHPCSLSPNRLSRMQRFALLTRSPAARACHYLSLKLQTFHFFIIT